MPFEEDMAGGRTFRLPLNGKTAGKRLAEAEKALAGIYPFGVSADEISVSKTDSRGIYDVRIIKDIPPEKGKRARIAAAFCVFVVLAVVLTVVFFKRADRIEADRIRKSEAERIEVENKKIKREKEERLSEVRKEYEKIERIRYAKVYPCIERIYSVLSPKSRIENLSMEKNSFNVEVRTDDAVRILENFEGSEAFGIVKMNRTNVENGTETVAYSGDFSSNEDSVDSSFSLESQLDFYSSKLEREKARSEKMKSVSLSEYIKNIRESLRKNGCSEQYIQVKESDGILDVEFFMVSSSRSLLEFLRNVQDKEDGPVDIKRIRIRNSLDKARVQTTVTFYTGIDSGKAEKDGHVYEPEGIPVSKIKGVFLGGSPKKAEMASSVKAAARPKPVFETHKKEERPQERKTPVLSYLGIVRNGKETVVLAKDSGMDAICKFPLAKEEIAGDFCIETGDGYKARFRGEYYEVRK